MKVPLATAVVRLRRHARLWSPRDLDVVASVSVGPSGEAVTVWTDQAGIAAIGPWKGQPDWLHAQEASRTRGTHNDCRAKPSRVAVTCQSSALDHLVEIPDLPLVSPIAQPLRDGRVLMVSSVCAWRPLAPDKNAIVYGPHGSAEGEATLGDGIAVLRTTSTDYTWAGYADTGIFGNNGWGHVAALPVGWSGVVGFSESLTVDWRFPTDELGPIDDCEAMTVTDESLWVWYYSGYRLARVDGSGVRVWENPAQGSHHRVPAYGAATLITDGDTVALAGGYPGRKTHDRILTARLDDELAPERALRLEMPDGGRLHEHAQMAGQGSDLNVFVGDQWFRIGLEDLA